MSVQILYQADILIDGIAASTEFSRIKLTLNQPIKDKSAFQDTARSSLPGIYAATADGEYYYQTGTSGFMATNKFEGATVGPSAGTFTPMVLTIGADLVVGNIVNIWKGVNAKAEEGASHGEILKGTVNTDAADRNVQATRLIRASGAISGTSGLSTAQQLGALSATQSLYAALHVIGSTFGTGTVFSIISSATSSLTSPTTRITFTNGTSALLGEWQSVAGAVTDTWWALKWLTFGGTAATVSVSAGIQ